MVDKPRPIAPPLRADRRHHLVDRAPGDAEIERVHRVPPVVVRLHLAHVFAQDGAGRYSLERPHADAFAAVGAQLDEWGVDGGGGTAVAGEGEGAGAGGVGGAVQAWLEARGVDFGGVFGVRAVGGPVGRRRRGVEGGGAVDVVADVELGPAVEGRAADVGELFRDDPFVRGRFLRRLIFAAEEVVVGRGEEAVEAGRLRPPFQPVLFGEDTQAHGVGVDARGHFLPRGRVEARGRFAERGRVGHFAQELPAAGLGGQGAVPRVGGIVAGRGVSGRLFVGVPHLAGLRVCGIV